MEGDCEHQGRRNGFKMNEAARGVGWFQRETMKGVKVRFSGRPSQLHSLLSMPVSGQRMLRPLVADWRSAPARCGGDRRPDPKDQLEKLASQMPFLLFAKGVEVEIAFAFSTLQSK